MCARSNSLPAGGTPYAGVLTFTNTTNASGTAGRSASLTVQPVLRGTLSLGDFTASPATVTCTVRLWQSGSLVRSQPVTLDSQSSFRLANVAAGTYSVKIQTDHWLSKTISNVPMTATGTDLGTVPLVNGDANDDNAVTADDLYVVLAGLEVEAISPDLDGDGAVTSTDLSIALKNLGRAGDL